jgi:SH3-like domain-containing protein
VIAPRNRILALAISATLAGASLMLPMSVLAQSAPAAAAADTVQQPFVGIINDDNVYVRSGPGEVFYATTKLNKGAKINVVAVRNDWLKIIPPDGSFCYVARAYVEKRGDGTVGRVTKAELNVRAGSALNGLKTTVQTSLAEGDDVKILPDQAQDEYFKIIPPPGAYLYVKKAFVDTTTEVQAAPIPIVAADKQSDPIASAPIPPVITPPAAAPTPVAAAPVTPAPTPMAAVTPVFQGASVTSTPTTNPTVAVAVKPSTQPSEVAVSPATQPVELSADAKFDAVESEFLDATNQPLDKQPVESLLTQYTALSKNSALPNSMMGIVQMRIATLKLRDDAQKQYADALKMQADAKARQVALRAESDELAQRVKDQSVSIYTALGTLRISSLQQSNTTLYRLTDPGTGRTLVYIKSNDPKYTVLLNQFIGVKGDVVEDTNMNIKTIAPTETTPVDPSKVNTTVTATIIPPSMLPKTATASVVGN